MDQKDKNPHNLTEAEMNGAKAVINRITEAYASKVVGQDELR